MQEAFKMTVEERLVIPGVPDVILAGPVTRGICKAGDRLELKGESGVRLASCLGVELINWGRGRDAWVSIRVSDVGLDDVSEITQVDGRRPS